MTNYDPLAVSPPTREEADGDYAEDCQIKARQGGPDADYWQREADEAIERNRRRAMQRQARRAAWA